MATHKCLFQRLRRRQRTIKQPNLHTSQRLHALTVRGKYSHLEIYAFRRMAASLEEPDRSRVLHLSQYHFSHTPPF